MVRTTASLTAQAAALEAELKMTCPRVNTPKELFEGIDDDVGGRRLSSRHMHETRLMEQIVILAHALVVMYFVLCKHLIASHANRKFPFLLFQVQGVGPLRSQRMG